MKIKHLLTKTLLVAAGLLLGGANSVWGQTTAFSQNFTGVGDPVSTDPSDYGFTVTTYNDGTATVTGGLLQYSLPANSNKDVSAWGTANFTAIPTGNVVTVSCSWNPGGPTGTRPYSTLRIYGSNGTEDKVVLSLYNQGQDKVLKRGDYDGNGTQIASGADWRSGSIVWNVVAVLNLNTQKVTSLTITKSGESTPAVTESNIAFENTVVSINKFEFGTNKKSNGAVTSTLDNVQISYEAAASTASVTYKYEDTSGNSLSAIKADVVESLEVGASIEDNISTTLKTSFKNADESIRYDYSTYTCADATVPAGGTTVTLKFAPKAKFTYNVNAVDAGSTTLGTIATVSGYAGETTSLFWSKYVKIGEKWYVSSESSFYQGDITSSGTKEIVYNESDIAYFIECENMNGVRSDRWVLETNASNSGYNKIRINNYYPTIYTDVFAEGGVFDIEIPYNNSNDGESTYQLRTRTSGGTLSSIITTWTSPKGSSTFNYNGLVVPAGSSVAISCDGISGNSNARMDYLILTPTKVSANIPSSGFATISSAYALDCGNLPSGLNAYKVSGYSSTSATLEPVTEAVAAGTGLILEGTAGDTYSIPVVASGTDISTSNKLHAAVTATTLDNGSFYVLKGGKFLLVTGATDEAKRTVPAGKAYLLASEITSAPELSLSFGNLTGIRSIENGKLTMDNVIYDLQGRKVAQPAKGLYIVNGKKVVIK